MIPGTTKSTRRTIGLSVAGAESAGAIVRLVRAVSIGRGAESAAAIASLALDVSTVCEAFVESFLLAQASTTLAAANASVRLIDNENAREMVRGVNPNQLRATDARDAALRNVLVQLASRGADFGHRTRPVLRRLR